MARGGINKALVKMAIARLVARNENPSLDAIRIELGNTGSKATIHRYLKEINEESEAASTGKKVSISDALTRFVESLANQLEQEAQDVIIQSNAGHEAALNTLKLQLNASELSNSQAAKQIDLLTVQVRASEDTRKELSSNFQTLSIKAERMEQQLIEKDMRLHDRETHIRSLEEKHLHAREALEHYRASVKDQRDQDQRRHEHQVQQLQAELRQLNQTLSIKQADITQLNKDNSQLSTEARELRKQLNDANNKVSSLGSQLSISEGRATIATQEAIKLAEIQEKSLQTMDDLREQLSLTERAFKVVEIEFTSTKTELVVKNQILDTLTGALKRENETSETHSH
jgi:chromosome segregation ATPase